jgi:hypothetical protein
LSDSAPRPCYIIIIIQYRAFSHTPRNTPHLLNGIPRTPATHADPWLTVRLHTNRCLSFSGKLISKTEKDSKGYQATRRCRRFQAVQSRALRSFVSLRKNCHAHKRVSFFSPASSTFMSTTMLLILASRCPSEPGPSSRRTYSINCGEAFGMYDRTR